MGFIQCTQMAKSPGYPIAISFIKAVVALFCTNYFGNIFCHRRFFSYT
uniref:Uncharacterized protein n=1 Tax=Escherichia coli TaxID=562 RepID=A0A8E6P3E0_ECOLX|nr:hypothetical protein FDGFPMFE_00007 [Escherichia coli]QVQ62076.1 hypothetical protein FDGFPMFE_00034 [Escherichia coli]QVQ62214.1 hypothetical protein FDGFPMFE_00172 [Escherichia coli]QVQ62241.1 hypothetical protein FDGFPMFE_00199 [Escherichia coli]